MPAIRVWGDEATGHRDAGDRAIGDIAPLDGCPRSQNPPAQLQPELDQELDGDRRDHGSHGA